MSSYTTTPYLSPTSLLTLRSQLYPPTATPKSQTDAIAQIQAWKLRSTNLPHAIESTALLLDAQLFHHHHPLQSQQAQPETNSSRRIRTLYTSAFTRFVTGFCDIGRSRERSLEPSSMLVIAKQIGMPEAWVALRHEGVHGEIAGLARLVDAVEGALGWLWGVYWSKLDERRVRGDLRKVEGREMSVEEMGKVLREFRRQRVLALREGLRGDELEGLVQEMGLELEGRWATLAEVLVAERLLLPVTRDLGANLDGAFLIWDQLLTRLFERCGTFRATLVSALLENLAAENKSDPSKDADKEAFTLWVVHVIETEPSLRVEAMKWCCLHPGHWSEYMGRQMLEDESIAEGWREVFEASLLTSESEAMGGVIEVAGQKPQMKCDANPVADAIPRPKTGWTRAVLPIAAPIGLVR